MVLVRHIKDAELLIKKPSEAALLFHEHSVNRHEWNVSSSRGYSATIPLFYFDFSEVAYREVQPTQEDIVKFMRWVID